MSLCPSTFSYLFGKRFQPHSSCRFHFWESIGAKYMLNLWSNYSWVTDYTLNIYFSFLKLIHHCLHYDAGPKIPSTKLCYSYIMYTVGIVNKLVLLWFVIMSFGQSKLSTDCFTWMHLFIWNLSVRREATGNSLVVQWLRLRTPNAGDLGLISG